MSPREKLFDWIKGVYRERRIRVSGKPYPEHLVFVAEFAKDKAQFGYEIGLCHDLFEDMERESFLTVLMGLGFSGLEAGMIACTLEELASVYSKAAFPKQTKKGRRRMENQRLEHVSPEAQSLKYGDVIYNARWMVEFEPNKSERYLKRKIKLIGRMDKGNQELRSAALSIIDGLVTIESVLHNIL